MEIIDKIKGAINKGFTCDVDRGIVYGSRGFEIKRRDRSGYIVISYISDAGKRINLPAHHLIYYAKYQKAAKLIDHINEIKYDNRIVNLREATKQLNSLNISSSKGYYFHKQSGKWNAQITIDGKHKSLGLYENEYDAKIAYVTYKNKYISDGR